MAVFAARRLRRTRSRSLAILWSAGITGIFYSGVRCASASGRIDSRGTR